MLKATLPPQIFVTGTDTDVGKTVLSGVLCLGMDAHYWKPVQSGFPTDSETISTWIGKTRVLPEGVVLNHPLSPNQAARKDGIHIKPEDIVMPDIDVPLVVEGAGGLMVPITETFMMIDLIKQFGLPVVLAARSGLGTLNHTLLSIEALRKRDMRLLGVVLIGPEMPETARDLAHFGQTTILGRLPILKNLNRQTLTDAFANL